MPQGQIVLGPEYPECGTSSGMPKRSEAVIQDPASSVIQDQAGKRLAAVRKLTGLRQEDVATMLGVDQSQWSKWEKGKQMPNLLIMVKFARRAKTSLDLIYRGVLVGTHPALQKLLEATIPDLLVPDPTRTDQDTDTALASYRSAILQESTR